MRFMAIVKADERSEAGEMPTEAELTAMGNYNDELVKAGIMLAGEGLHPSSKGARVTLNNEGTTVTDGPFAETKELIAGFWLLQAKSWDEALEWVKRAPKPPAGAGDFVIEVRQVFEAEDFGDEYTPELRAQEERQRAQVEANQRG
jgi:hypothetical protein